MGLWSRVRLPRKSRGSWWRMAAWRRWVVAVGEWWSLTGDISRWVVAGWSGGRLVRRSDGLNGGGCDRYGGEVAGGAGTGDDAYR
ncbi:hypothetical protein BMONG18_1037 [Bifidobacterium mongoliense]|uniref:Uncharacterized protein n=1 Tax=Bifidobacterium mongoliense TaxID=518643 RepID=A0A423UDG5_9BIFI|nr:hypothetical protein BMONG18_1037 [Bifidobacterium mongoliense]